jgi:hypothetical protein
VPDTRHEYTWAIYGGYQGQNLGGRPMYMWDRLFTDDNSWWNVIKQGKRIDRNLHYVKAIKFEDLDKELFLLKI